MGHIYLLAKWEETKTLLERKGVGIRSLSFFRCPLKGYSVFVGKTWNSKDDTGKLKKYHVRAGA